MTAQNVGVAAFPAIPEAVSKARSYVREQIRTYRVDVDDAVVAFSELFTNAILHSYSRQPGGIVGVSILDAGDVLRIEVIDEGCDGDGPAMRDAFDEGGMGLHVVASYTTRWGYERRRRENCELTVVWFEIEMARGD